MKQLILGGTRSGKSALAARIATDTGLPVTLVATAQPLDPEMTERIERHRRQRPPHWSTVETPLHLARTLIEVAKPGGCLLVDCLTLWLSNLLLHPDGDLLEQERQALVACLEDLPGELILVSNETGLGIIPMGALTRRFVDEAGWLHHCVVRRRIRVPASFRRYEERHHARINHESSQLAARNGNDTYPKRHFRLPRRNKGKRLENNQVRRKNIPA
jgi:adenosylcobinamide kinase/adenosylcobinamide-phosphate guanylyltransferase